MPPKRTPRRRRFRAPYSANAVAIVGHRLVAAIEVLTFDCYGTLIDWEAGILAGLRRSSRGLSRRADDALLEAYARHEARLEAGRGSRIGRSSREALDADLRRAGRVSRRRRSGGVRRFGRRLAGVPDSAEALARLAERFELGVITNCDNDLFELSDAKLGRPFAWRHHGPAGGSYKPAARNFELALERIGLPRERILHVAQSLYHDHVPAQAIGCARCGSTAATAAAGIRGHSPGDGHARPGRARHGDLRRHGPRLSRLPFAAR